MESPSEASVDSVPIIPINPVNPVSPPSRPAATEEASVANSSAPRKRACDECRAKKLRCTKELDGCARCKRQKLRCHYSPQKPMGRPRKFYSLSSMSPQNRRSEPQLSNYMSPLFVSESVNSIAAPMAVRNSAMALHNLANAASADLSTTHSSPASSYLDLRGSSQTQHSTPQQQHPHLPSHQTPGYGATPYASSQASAAHYSGMTPRTFSAAAAGYLPTSSFAGVNRRLSPILPKTGCPQCGWPIHAGAYAHQQPTSPSHLERYPADLNR